MDRGDTQWGIGVGERATAGRQYRNREGQVKVPRKHPETVTDADGQEHAVKAGVWTSNQKGRRAALTAERAAVLNELGVL